MKYSLFQNIRYKKNKRDIAHTSSIWRNEAKKYLCLGRNAIVVIFGTVLAYVLNVYDIHPFTLTGEIFKRISSVYFSFDIEHRKHFWFKLIYRQDKQGKKCEIAFKIMVITEKTYVLFCSRTDNHKTQCMLSNYSNSVP